MMQRDFELKWRLIFLKKMPQKGDIESLFTRLDHFISQYDPQWKNRIEGTSEDEINYLKEINKIDEREIDYPEDYLVYMKYMGKQDDGLLGCTLPGKVKTNYSTVLENIGYWFEEIEEFDQIDKSSFLIGFNQEVGLDYFLYYHNRPSYVICDGGFGSIISTSIEKLLFQNAIKKYEEQTQSYMREFHCRPLKRKQRNLYKEFNGDVNKLFHYLLEQKEDFFSEIHKVCERYEMEHLWISDVVNDIYYSERGLFWIYSEQDAYGDMHGVIISNSKQFADGFLSRVQKIKGYEILI